MAANGGEDGCANGESGIGRIDDWMRAGAGRDAISKFCKPGPAPTDKTVLDYQVEPSMVVHDDTLDVTFADARTAQPDRSGRPPDSLFSFGRTIDTILRSAGTITDAMTDEQRQTARVTFVQTMIDQLRQRRRRHAQSDVGASYRSTIV